MPETIAPRGRQPITPDDTARLDAALETVHGNRTHAAKILGWDRHRVDNIINLREEMRLKWGLSKKDVPDGSLADTIDREPTALAQFSRDEVEASAAIARQDSILENTWAKSGFTSEQREFLSTLQNSYAINLKSTVDLTYGGMVHTATRLLMLFEDLVMKIKAIDDNPDDYVRVHRTEFGENEVKTAHEYRCELYDRLISISAEMRKVHTDVNKAQYVRAQLEALRRGSGGGNTPLKGGWPVGAPPLAVQVNVNGTKTEVVTTHMDPDESSDS